jgi:hypothetical protein
MQLPVQAAMLDCFVYFSANEVAESATVWKSEVARFLVKFHCTSVLRRYACKRSHFCQLLYFEVQSGY